MLVRDGTDERVQRELAAHEVPNIEAAALARAVAAQPRPPGRSPPHVAVYGQPLSWVQRRAKNLAEPLEQPGKGGAGRSSHRGSRQHYY